MSVKTVTVQRADVLRHVGAIHSLIDFCRLHARPHPTDDICAAILDVCDTVESALEGSASDNEVSPP